MSNASYSRVSSLVTRLTSVLALFVAIVPTCIFAASIYFSVSTNLAANLRVQAITMENTISTRPEYWDMNPDRLHASYARFVAPNEHFVIRTTQGKIVVQLGPPNAWHTLVRSQALYDFGNKVGEIEAGRSMLAEILWGALLLGISLIVAWLIHSPLRRVPLMALAEAEAKLLKREQYQRALLDNFPFMVWLQDEQQRILAANTKLAEHFQHNSSDDLSGKLPTELALDGLSKLMAQDASTMLQTKVEAHYERQIEIQQRCSWFEIYQAPVFLPSGIALGTVGYARDISDNKQAEQELEQHRHHLEELIQIRTAELSTALEEAQSAYRLKTEFVSTVSHELRTPLTAISGALGLVTGGVLGEVAPRMRPILEIAHKNSLLLSNLINDLLDIEKLSAGKLTLDLQVLLLADVVERSIESCAGMMSLHEAKVLVDNPYPELRVNADSMRLQQVLSNLLSNAAKFSFVGSTIEIHVLQRNAVARVEVIDHGAGVPAQFRSRIFQKFAQADSSDTRKKGGTGLGLAISKELIEQMQGSLGFNSEEGQGSCFYFELPLANADAQ